MELDIDNTYDGMDYKYWIQQAQQMEPACTRILQKLPLEDQAVLEKHKSLMAKANEAYSKLAYITGYQHGLKRGKR